MKLRIVAGSLKGRTLSFPPNDTEFRPTLERARTSVADMLQRWLSGAVTADLCAGSGAFGFEMLSRGAASVDFVESDRRRAEAIRKAAERFGVADQCRIIAQDVHGFTQRCSKRYDIIFYDPPYDDHALAGVMVPVLMGLLSANGVLVYQRRKIRGEKAGAGRTETLFDTRIFGDTIVDFYRSAEQKNE